MNPCACSSCGGGGCTIMSSGCGEKKGHWPQTFDPTESLKVKLGFCELPEFLIFGVSIVAKYSAPPSNRKSSPTSSSSSRSNLVKILHRLDCSELESLELSPLNVSKQVSSISFLSCKEISVFFAQVFG